MRKQSIDGALIKDAGSERASADRCKQQMLARSERQQTHTQMKLPVRSERGQIDRCLTHTRTLAGSERASANRCKKLQSINKLAEKERHQQIQLNQIKYTHRDCKEWFAILPVGWRMSDWVGRRARCEVAWAKGCNIHRIAKDSDNTEDSLEEIS